jgi:hypothetical protein
MTSKRSYQEGKEKKLQVKVMQAKPLKDQLLVLFEVLS